MIRCVQIAACLLALVSCEAEDPPNPAPKAQPGTQPGTQPPAPRPVDGHLRMLAVLKEIARQTGENHPYLGRAQVRQIEAGLAKLGEAATGRPACEAHFALGQALLRLGETRPAITHLSRSVALLAGAGLDQGTIDYVKFRLGVAWMRLGETENCCAAGGPESCILPIRGGGVHTKTAGSKNAIRLFEAVLASKASGPHVRSDNAANAAASVNLKLSARWLLNVAWMTLGGYPDKVPEAYRMPNAAFESSVEFPRFRNVAGSAKLDTFSLCGGVILDDFDGDFDLDVVTSTWDPRGPLRLFVNNGDGTFTDRTQEAQLTGITGGLNINQTDYNNDGHLDIFVMRGAWLGASGQLPNSLLRNNGDGTFRDVTFESGLAQVMLPTQTSAWGDIDNDGWLDLFVGNEHSEGQQGGIRAPCQLFLNRRDGTFQDIAPRLGLENLAYTKGVALGDYDADGALDIYLSNYDAPNRLYHNNGDGTFTDVAKQAGVEMPHVGFPTWFFDFDNDGHLDIFAASYTGRLDSLTAFVLGQDPEFESAHLYKGDGKGGFEDVAVAAGLRYPMLPMGANYGDLDNDGFLDIYLGTGDPDYETLMPNRMFWNRGGEKFVDVTMAGGFGHLQKGHGIAFGDIDNDGDIDVFEQMGGAFSGDRFGDALFENPGFDNHWLAIRCVGAQSNRAAIGARIRVDLVGADGEKRSIFRRVKTGGSFGSNPLRQTIGLGKAEKVARLEVKWPKTGIAQHWENVPADVLLRVVEGEDKVQARRLTGFKLK